MKEKLKKLIQELKDEQPSNSQWLEKYEEGCFDKRKDIIEKLEDILEGEEDDG